MLKKLMVICLGLSLPLSTLVAYAWWNQIQTEIEIVDIQIGYGSRIQLTNLTSDNQGQLVPKSSMHANQDGYTSAYEFSFKVQFTEDLNLANLIIEFSNIQLTKGEEIEFYTKDNEKVSCLDLTLSSVDESIPFLEISSIVLTGSYVYVVIPQGEFTIPVSRFELIVEINESLLNETCSNFIQNRLLRFDVMVEANI